MPPMPIEIFCSSAEEDASLLESLERHLSVLWREGQITIWHRDKITAGSDWQVKQDQHLNTASLILLLISSAYFESDHCYGVEMQRAMQRHEVGEARVIPLLLDSVDWQRAPFRRLKALPSNGKPVTTWSNRNMAFADIVQGIRVALDDIRHLPPASALSGVWNVPYWRNQYFTGRDQELERLHGQLQQRTTAAIGQIQAINGLGGIGKTELAIEYACRYVADYQRVLFARADSTEALISAYIEIAAQLNLPEKNTKEQEVIVQAVKTWLKTHQHYLLILDNADEPELLNQFVPSDAKGHFLITTRAADLSALKLCIVNPLALSNFSEEQGTLFLLHRANLLAQVDQHTREQAKQLVHALDGFPLALDHAGAYLCTTKCDLDDYLQLYQQWGPPLLDEHSGDGSSRAS